jgi:triacylglycerol lipase
MSSVYFPAHVVLILRRIVNVISTLSISNQYLLLKRASTDEQRGSCGGVGSSHDLSSSSLKNSLRVELSGVGVEWPWWVYERGWEWPWIVRQVGRSVAPSHAYTTSGNEVGLYFH